MFYIKRTSVLFGLLLSRSQQHLGWKSCICITLLLSIFIDNTFTRWYNARRARKLGCGPPIRRPQAYLYGIDLISRALAADKRNDIPGYFNEVFSVTCPPHNRTYEQFVFGKANYFTCEPKNIQAILATQFNDFALGDLRRQAFFALLGNGIFTADGKSWEHSRTLLRPQFTRDQISDLDMEERHVQDMFKHVRVQAEGWTQPIDVKPLFFRLTVDSATEFLFGHSVQSQIAALPDDSIERQNFQKRGGLEWENMAGCFDEATRALGYRVRFDELWWLYSPRTFYDNCAKVHKFADYYVDLALSNDLYTMKQSFSPSSPDIKRPKYIFLGELVKSTRDPVELRSQLLNILLAGRDTTAGLLGWTFWLLARNPRVFEKLRKSILDDFGTYHHPHEISFTSLKACQYLQHTLHEVLRLFPSVPVNQRRAVRDTTLPVGGGPDGSLPLFVPKGQEVNYSVYALHRRSEIWGSDAHDFRPERWTARKAGWEWLPFNGGPRICLGMSFALTEAGYVIVRMLQRYDRIRNLDEGHDYPLHQYSVTSAPVCVNLSFHEASSGT